MWHRHKQNEAWRYFSYSLVHTDDTHLSVNLVLLMCLGTSLHLTNSAIGLLFLYLLGVSTAHWAESFWMADGCTGCVRVDGLLCLGHKIFIFGWMQWRRFLSCWYLHSLSILFLLAINLRSFEAWFTLKVPFSPQCSWTGRLTVLSLSNTGQAGQ